MSTRIIASERTFGPIVRLALPVLAENLLHVLVEYVDMWLTGNYLRSEASLAAISLAGYVMWMVFTVFAVVAVGSTAMTARFVGAGDYDQARRVIHQSFILGAGVAALAVVIGLAGVERFVFLLQLEGEAAALAVRYLRIVLWVLPAIMLEEVGIACLRGAGDTVSGLVAMAIVNVVNIVVSTSLLLGLGPLEPMGFAGLAYGTATAHVVGGLIIVGLLMHGRAGLRLEWNRLRPDAAFLRRLLRIGLPAGTDSMSVVLCQLWFLSIINQLGNVAAAAHGVGVRIEALAFMPGAAFQVAAATLAGQYLGARDYERATRSVAMVSALGFLLMACVGGLFYSAATELSEFFLGGESVVVPLSAELLRIVAFSMPALALLMILTGALRGAGDTRFPLLFTSLGFLGIRIPLAYLLAHESIHIPGTAIVIAGFGLGVVGAWYAMILDVGFRAALVVLRFRHGGWKHIEV